MSTRTHLRKLQPRCGSLSLAIALAIAAGAFATFPGKLRAAQLPASDSVPDRPAATHQVTNCNDSGPGSLTAVIADPTTGDHDLIDLTSLKMVCSKISVHAVAIYQDNLYLQGPGAKYLTIDAGNSGSLLRHFGGGTLVIQGLTLVNGSYSGPIKPVGACVYSTGSVSLIDSVVSHCTIEGTSSNEALGAGIYAQGDLHLLRSTISDSHVTGDDAAARGGGVYVKGNLTALYSTISNNTSAATLGVAYGFAGGLQVNGDVDIENSTISGNTADVDGAIVVAGGASHVATIVNSTISDNLGTTEGGGIWTDVPLTMTNSTVAFNHTSLGGAGHGDGLYTRAAAIELESTIISGNSDPSGADDLGGTSVVNGFRNVVVASSLGLPNDTDHNCPNLDLLADNGGDTLTHGLKTPSGAIDQGSADMTLSIDQRLAPRVTGARADIGAVEWRQTDRAERVLANGFDGLCDQ